MLRVFVVISFLQLACTGPSVNGYTLGTLSSGRGQEYSGGYRTGGFVGTKDARGDYSENGGSHGYSVHSGGPGYSSTTGSSYGSTDSGYADPSIVGSGHAGAYGSANSQGSNTLSLSSYTTELRGGQATSSGHVGASYKTGGTSSGGAYASVNGADSRLVGHVTTGLIDNSESSVSDGAGAESHAGGLSVVERGEYSSPQPSSGSYGSYTIGAPKVAAYVSSSGLVTPVSQATLSNGIIGSYSSSPSFSPVAHRPIVASSHSSHASGHPATSVLGYATSGSSLKGSFANIHGANGHNYAGHGSSHRGSHGHHLYAAASNPSPGYTSRGPGYFAVNGPYNRGNVGLGGKIFVVNEGSAVHHGGHQGEHRAVYSGPAYGSSTNYGYKMRNGVSSGSHGPTSFTNGYSSVGAYNVPSSLASLQNGNKHAGSFFGFL